MPVSPGASPDTRLLAGQAFSRAAGAPLVTGNAVRLLCDARENYPAWLEAIARAKQHVHFETYILHEDAAGERFAAALQAKARAGVAVRVVYDWLGGLGRTSRRFWRRLADAGVEVRCYNPPALAEPFGWLSRDHRKCLIADAEVAFVTGLCVGRMWEGDPARGLAPWRDTGVELRGPAVLEVARAFADTWGACGAPLPKQALPREPPAPVGDVALRVVADTPGMAALFRVDQLAAALARERLWLTDAYYAGTSTYVQALRSAAQDGVDVRLLVPGRGNDIPVMQLVSRAGYRALLEAGVRVFEWNGPMIHAKTAVADGRWARVGSTNLNVASWMGNRELDVVVEDARFARAMEQQYLEDLGGATEVVLGRRRVAPASGAKTPRIRGAGGSAGRAAAGALRLGNALGSALSPRRIHRAGDRTVLAGASAALVAAGLVGALWPWAIAWPIAAAALWLGVVLLLKAARREASSPPRSRDGG